VPGFEINTSCIKGIKSIYKAEEWFKGYRIRGMTEYQEAKREAEKEARRKASKIEAAPESESGAGAAEEQSTRRTRQAMPKRPRASASQGEPN